MTIPNARSQALLTILLLSLTVTPEAEAQAGAIRRAPWN